MYAARIYRIVCDVDNTEYVGSTKAKLSARMVEHRSMSKTCTSGKLYPKMKQLGTDHFKIYLIEEVQVANHEQMRAREQEVIEERRPEMNLCKAWISEQDRHTRNKAYMNKNKDRINEQRRKRNENGNAYKTTKLLYQKNVELKRYECCGKAFSSQPKLTRHKSTVKHMNRCDITIQDDE